MRRKLYLELYNLLVGMEKGEITPLHGMTAQCNPESPQFASKSNKFSQPYNHLCEYLNRYHAKFPEEGEPDFVMPKFICLEELETEEPDLTDYLSNLPDWMELGYKLSRFKQASDNYYNPVAIATMYRLETGITVSPDFVETRLRELKVKHPKSINLNFCRHPSNKPSNLTAIDKHSQLMTHLGASDEV